MKNTIKSSSIVAVAFIVIIIIVFINSQEKMSIEPLKLLDTVITQKFKGKIFTDKFVAYKVVGYKDNKASAKFIDDFIRRNKDPKLNSINRYTITFYQASDETNAISLKQHPDRYYNQNTTIYEYKWFKGKFIVRYKFDDGRITEPESKVKIRDVPIPPDSTK